MRSVNGLLHTTANLAEVVSGLPTSGLKANASDASGDRASAAAAFSCNSNRVPSPLPPKNCRKRLSGSGSAVAAPAVRSTRKQVP